MEIIIPPDIEQLLWVRAVNENLAVDEYVVQLLRQGLASVTIPALPESPRLSTIESGLLEIINQGLTAEEWGRLHGLDQKRQAETLTQEEHELLITLTDKLEIIHAYRMQALVQLSDLRGTSLTELMTSLGIGHGSPAQIIQAF